MNLENSIDISGWTQFSAHYRSLPVTIAHYYPLPATTAHYRPLLPTTGHYCPLLPTTAHFYGHHQEYR